MSSAKNWLEGARPHTWANAFAPVLAGSGAAAAIGGFHFGRALLALIVAWALIIGVNFANDYSDGIRGTDDDRSGPQRLTGGGLAKPQHVKFAAFGCFAVAGVAGIWLSLAAGAWWFILIGALCIAGAWFYTGGKNPYGYRGLGEVAVFVFFGLVAVLGTQFTQAGTLSFTGLLLALGIGGMSAAVNLANNIRDIPSDSQTGKITLAVRLGDGRSRTLFTILLALPVAYTLLIAIGSWAALIGLVYIPFALTSVRIINKGARGPELIPVLGLTGRAMLIWAVTTALAVALV
ncbi:1,4-dihydroxy-2-naphthoate polyprenyltransferase [Corynebacterium casei]|uniref:1,4-dihydroxy-2-naphthoate octaprenyltransferase n=1 Tax=Corynebacterium casei LMG S-19264 TaxID=1285583 RepID=A0ABM5PMD0_9CORY|nr:1,4-dihydroxy-2-naphthoate polyprenyltransferase [Corynebacterium casei]AHI19070.1 1,4-dihydroxy-2-naphthoate octaprenyltransferase [Corynebacterium casei LMG S-19264]MDN5783418.1 1,4-dihydroxy-2-naphthoate polyprenyltransferase [Corynebacterium casei]MDN5799961.1 1,4-dihydroxy-2-naphthoate polyprenyltransferase [Corynebacterium casei]MDN5841236.1 1,4-dihydroxy-2-naphthoate polyprenyltransferase [Corynebacterium casei]MDN5923137.1 1,4-dihydroxy-2-naphthoate polyprenyltransferase [Corynebact